MLITSAVIFVTNYRIITIFLIHFITKRFIFPLLLYLCIYICMHVCRYMCIICLFRCQVFSVTRHCIPERRFLTDPGTQPSSQQARELPHLHPPLRSTYKRTGFLCGFRGFELRSSCPRSKWTISPSTLNVLFCFGMFLRSRNRSVQTPLPPHSRSLLPVPPIQLPNLSD